MAMQLNVTVNPVFNSSVFTAAGARAGASFAAGLNSATSKSQPLGRITGQVSEFEKSMEAANARVLAFGASAGSIYIIKSAFDKLVSSTIEVEKSLTDINNVLGLSSSSMKNFSDEMFKAASLTGQTFETASKVALEFSRQGTNAEETVKRMTAAMQLMRISGLSAEDSVNSITASLNAFSREILTAEDVVNRITAVDTKFAVSSKDLANAIQRVGSVANDAGVEFNQLLGLVTSAQTITARGGAVIGNAFKSIFTRLARPQVLEDLEAVGVTTTNASGQILPMITILKNLANQYNTLGASQKSFVSEAVGGVYQVNILKAALADLGNGMSIFDRATASASQSAGLIEKRMAELNETISSKLNTSALEMTKLFSNIGQTAFGSGTKSAIDSFNKNIAFISAGFEKIAPDDSFGEKTGKILAQGISKGLGNVLSGPGVQIITVLLLKMLTNLGAFALKSSASFLGINQSLEKQKAIVSDVQTFLQRNPQILDAIKNGQLNVNQAHLVYLKQLRDEAQLRAQNQSIAQTMATAASPFIKATKAPPTPATGFIPNFSKSPHTQMMANVEKQRALENGYTPGPAIQKMIYDGNGGAHWTTVNGAETIKTITNEKGNKATFIIPPNGFGPDTLTAAKGFVPNFAETEAQTERRMAISHGYSPGPVFKTLVHDGKGGASLSTVNGAEKIKTVTNEKGYKATFVVPPNGFGKNTQFAAEGFIPNFRTLKTPEKTVGQIINKYKRSKSELNERVQENDIINISPIKIEEIPFDKDGEVAKAYQKIRLNRLEIDKAAKVIEESTQKSIGGKLTSAKDSGIKYGSNSALDIVGEDFVAEVKSGSFDDDKVREKFLRFPIENAGQRRGIYPYSGKFTNKQDTITSPSDLRLYTKPSKDKIDEEIKKLKASGFVPNFASKIGVITGDALRGNQYKKALEYLANTNKPIATVIGPAGSGKTIRAVNEYGGEIIKSTNFDDYASFVFDRAGFDLPQKDAVSAENIKKILKKSGSIDVLISSRDTLKKAREKRAGEGDKNIPERTYFKTGSGGAGTFAKEVRGFLSENENARAFQLKQKEGGEFYHKPLNLASGFVPNFAEQTGPANPEARISDAAVIAGSFQQVWDKRISKELEKEAERKLKAKIPKGIPTTEEANLRTRYEETAGNALTNYLETSPELKYTKILRRFHTNILPGGGSFSGFDYILDTFTNNNFLKNKLNWKDNYLMDVNGKQLTGAKGKMLLSMKTSKSNEKAADIRRKMELGKEKLINIGALGAEEQTSEMLIGLYNSPLANQAQSFKKSKKQLGKEDYNIIGPRNEYGNRGPIKTVAASGFVPNFVSQRGIEAMERIANGKGGGTQGEIDAAKAALDRLKSKTKILRSPFGVDVFEALDLDIESSHAIEQAARKIYGKDAYVNVDPKFASELKKLIKINPKIVHDFESLEKAMGKNIGATSFVASGYVPNFAYNYYSKYSSSYNKKSGPWPSKSLQREKEERRRQKELYGGYYKSPEITSDPWSKKSAQDHLASGHVPNFASPDYFKNSVKETLKILNIDPNSINNQNFDLIAETVRKKDIEENNKRREKGGRFDIIPLLEFYKDTLRKIVYPNEPTVRSGSGKYSRLSSGFVPNFNFSKLEQKTIDNILIERIKKARRNGAQSVHEIFTPEEINQAGFTKLDQMFYGEYKTNTNPWSKNFAKDRLAFGFVPNFASDALSNAINRETSNTGISLSQVRINRNSKLVSSQNPLGLAVTNTRDEGPFGDPNIGITRAKKMGLNPKTHGMNNSGGYIPNFAVGESMGFGMLQFLSLESQRFAKATERFSFGLEKGAIKTRDLYNEFDKTKARIRELGEAKKTRPLTADESRELTDLVAKTRSMVASSPMLLNRQQKMDFLQRYEKASELKEKISQKASMVSLGAPMLGGIASTMTEQLFAQPDMAKGINTFSQGIGSAGQALMAMPNKLGAVLAIGVVTKGINDSLIEWKSGVEEAKKSYERHKVIVEKTNGALSSLQEGYNNLDTVLQSAGTNLSQLNLAHKKIFKAMADLAAVSPEYSRKMAMAKTPEARAEVQAEIIEEQDLKSRELAFSAQYKEMKKRNMAFGGFVDLSEGKKYGEFTAANTAEVQEMELAKTEASGIIREQAIVSMEKGTKEEKEKAKRIRANISSGSMTEEDREEIMKRVGGTSQYQALSKGGQFAVREKLEQTFNELVIPADKREAYKKAIEEIRLAQIKEVNLRKRYNQELQNLLSRGVAISQFRNQSYQQGLEQKGREIGTKYAVGESDMRLKSLVTSEYDMIRMRGESKQKQIKEESGLEVEKIKSSAGTSQLDFLNKALEERTSEMMSAAFDKTGSTVQGVSPIILKHKEFLAKRQELFSGEGASKLFDLSKGQPKEFAKKFLGSEEEAAKSGIGKEEYGNLETKIQNALITPEFTKQSGDTLLKIKDVLEKGNEEAKKSAADTQAALKEANFKEMSQALGGLSLLARGGERQMRRRIRRAEYLSERGRTAQSRGRGASELLSLIPESQRDINNPYISRLYGQVQGGVLAANKRVLGGTSLGKSGVMGDLGFMSFAQTFGNLKASGMGPGFYEKAGLEIPEINVGPLDSSIAQASQDIDGFAGMLRSLGGDVDSLRNALNAASQQVSEKKEAAGTVKGGTQEQKPPGPDTGLNFERIIGNNIGPIIMMALGAVLLKGKGMGMGATGKLAGAGMLTSSATSMMGQGQAQGQQTVPNFAIVNDPAVLKALSREKKQMGPSSEPTVGYIPSFGIGVYDKKTQGSLEKAIRMHKEFGDKNLQNAGAHGPFVPNFAIDKNMLPSGVPLYSPDGYSRYRVGKEYYVFSPQGNKITNPKTIKRVAETVNSIRNPKALSSIELVNRRLKIERELENIKTSQLTPKVLVQREAGASKAAAQGAQVAQTAAKVSRMSKIGGALKGSMKGAGLIGTALSVGISGYEAYQNYKSGNFEGGDRAVAGGIGGTIGGIIGGAIGTLIPIPIVGTTVGAMLGAWAGAKLGQLATPAITNIRRLVSNAENLAEYKKQSELDKQLKALEDSKKKFQEEFSGIKTQKDVLTYLNKKGVLNKGKINYAEMGEIFKSDKNLVNRGGLGKLLGTTLSEDSAQTLKRKQKEYSYLQGNRDKFSSDEENQVFSEINYIKSKSRQDFLGDSTKYEQRLGKLSIIGGAIASNDPKIFRKTMDALGEEKLEGFISGDGKAIASGKSVTGEQLIAIGARGNEKDRKALLTNAYSGQAIKKILENPDAQSMLALQFVANPNLANSLPVDDLHHLTNLDKEGKISPQSLKFLEQRLRTKEGEQLLNVMDKTLFVPNFAIAPRAMASNPSGPVAPPSSPESKNKGPEESKLTINQSPSPSLISTNNQNTEAMLGELLKRLDPKTTNSYLAQIAANTKGSSRIMAPG